MKFAIAAIIMLACSLLQPTETIPTSTSEPLAETSAIASDSKRGVDVRINQLQIQRIGGPVEMSLLFRKTGMNGDNFARFISLSISQKGQGKTSGPTFISLKNGDVLSPCLFSSTKFMSAIANAETTKDYDYMEASFKIPADTAFTDIFPISITHETTDAGQRKVKFVFEDISP